MTISEQIKSVLTQRAGALAGMEALHATASEGEGRDFTAEEQTAFDGHKSSITTLDAKLDNLKSLERAQATAAVPVATVPGTPVATPETRVIPFKPFPGQAFTRYVGAIAAAKGNMVLAAMLAERWKDQTPEVHAVLDAIARTGMGPAEVYKAAVAAGTTTHATWAGPLIYAQNLTSEFIELLRAETIIGKLPMRSVPFNVSIPRQNSGVAAGWVGEGMSKPVGALSFDRITIPWAKIAVIAVITDELARFSSPSAEMLVRNDMIAAITLFKDQQFIDPAITATANLRPASITNGVTPVASSGITMVQIDDDVRKMMANMAAAGLPLTGLYWIMSPLARLRIQTLHTSQDLPAYPEAQNLMFKGYPVIESNVIPVVAGTPDTTYLVLVNPNEVYHAEDPVIDIGVSTEASIQMDSAPATPPTPLVSLWQQNMVGIKAEQYEYWLRRRLQAVQMLSGFNVE